MSNTLRFRTSVMPRSMPISAPGVIPPGLPSAAATASHVPGMQNSLWLAISRVCARRARSNPCRVKSAGAEKFSFVLWYAGQVKFSTTMFQDGNNTGVEVPADVVAALGAGKRPAVVVNVNGYEYRSTVAPMGGRFLLPFSAARRQESGIKGGDAIDVELSLDKAPRTV